MGKKDSCWWCFTRKPSMLASRNLPLGSTGQRGATSGCFHTTVEQQMRLPQLPSPQSRSDCAQQPGEPCATAALGLLSLLRTWVPIWKLQHVQEGARGQSHHSRGLAPTSCRTQGRLRWIWRNDWQDTAEHWKLIYFLRKKYGTAR